MRQSELISDIINGIAETEKEETEQAKIAEDVAEDDRVNVNEESNKNSAEENVEENGKEKADTTETSLEMAPVDDKDGEIGTSEILESGGRPRRSARIASGIKPPNRYVHASFVKRDRWKEDAAKQAIKSEIKQLFKDLSALEPVQATSIVAGACVLTCHMFLVEKLIGKSFLTSCHLQLLSTQ
jgi:hypothetical protein